MQTAVALICHGSKDPKWRGVFETLAIKLQQAHPEQIMALCYMEIATPTLMDIVAGWSKTLAGPKNFRVRVLPLFMASGGHVDNDIPVLVREVAEAFPGLDIVMERPIGENPMVVAAIGDIVTELCANP
jgi:sirohydrochlorin cobaltochelatase